MCSVSEKARQPWGAASADHPNADDQRDIAHSLLVELLSYQFAFPVKWIDTQDSLLAESPRITRFLEFGPSKVLSGLMRRTLEARYGSKEMLQALGPEYDFLSCEHDADKIAYAYSSGPKLQEGKQREEKTPAGVADVPAAPSRDSKSFVAVTASSKQILSSSVADVPMPASFIIQNLVGHRLKKSWSAISLAKSLKELSGGRSTVQNELLSDLEVEFGNLPDHLEELALSELAAGIQKSHFGKLGGQSSTLVEKFIAAKMPSGWNASVVREHLKTRWGLGPLRQDAVLLMAATSDLSARLPSADGAQQHFESLVSVYATNEGIVLGVDPAQAENLQARPAMIDAGQFKELERGQKQLARKVHDALKGYLSDQQPLQQHMQLPDVPNSGKEQQDKVDLWHAEFSGDFEAAIRPMFKKEQLRSFRSVWNTARLNFLHFCHGFEMQQLSHADVQRAMFRLANCMDAPLAAMIESFVHTERSRTSTRTDRDAKLDSVVLELTEKLCRGGPQKPVFRYSKAPMAPRTTVGETGVVDVFEVPRDDKTGTTVHYPDLARKLLPVGDSSPALPCLHVKRKTRAGWTLDHQLTSTYHAVLTDATLQGLSFAGKSVLVTGGGPGSIAAEIVKGLLEGGARVIMTTSRAPSDAAQLCQQMFEENGASGSELLLVPFNQGSRQDCEALVEHIYSEKGLGRTLDAVFPFAAIADHGREIDGLGSRSELAHRLMMTNVLRLLGCIVKQKRLRGMKGQPTQVVLPLSSNHGTFGGDGLYAESKLGLESLFDRFASETWAAYLSVCGAVIGWTRGTGLMDANNLVAEAIEGHGVLTFSTAEMALNLLALLAEPIELACQGEPLWADLNGGLQLLPDLKAKIAQARAEIAEAAAINRAIAEEDAIELQLLGGHQAKSAKSGPPTAKRSNLNLGFPRLPDPEGELEPLSHLQDMVDPASVIVVVGFSELGPWGGARTRWEKERGEGFTIEGFLELAWLTGLIKHFDGLQKDGSHYVGWVDVLTQVPVRDDEIGTLYGERILAHCGIRPVEDGIHGGYGADGGEQLREIVVEEDLPAFDATKAAAEAFKARHGDKVDIWCAQGQSADEYKVQLKPGSTIMIPHIPDLKGKAVAGQIPSGFDASVYGVPEDIIAQVDAVTLYALCCTAEALFSAGIPDAYELFQHLHVSELGLFLGSSFGGMTKMRQMYTERHLGRDVPGDVLQDTLFNTTAAWLNMLLLGGAGPIKTPTGACATSIESLDAACDSILAGKTKMCLVGGVDDLNAENATGFRTMKATVDARDQLAKGRLPHEMSRPTAETRAGFVESHGCGVQLVCTAALALQMGLPIYAIIASSTMAADGIGRSVPAPGQGVLSFARETPEAARSPLLDIQYRRAQMAAFLAQDPAMDIVLETPATEADSYNASSSGSSSSASSINPGTPPEAAWDMNPPPKPDAMLKNPHHFSLNRKALAQSLYGTNLRSLDPSLSPLRAALAVWGLTVDAIDLVSLHGTSTRANDRNEPHIVQQQLAHLGRSPHGPPVPCVSQKALTGHPKAAAAAWMLNGCLQAVRDACVPGNAALDSVDDELRAHTHLVFPTQGGANNNNGGGNLRVREIRAFLLSSFGFGQKGGQVVGVAPKYLFAAVGKETTQAYAARVGARERRARRDYVRAMATNSIVAVKEAPPYDRDKAAEAYLRPFGAKMAGAVS